MTSGFQQVLIGGYPSGGLTTDRKPALLANEAFSSPARGHRRRLGLRPWNSRRGGRRRPGGSLADEHPRSRSDHRPHRGLARRGAGRLGRLSGALSGPASG